MAKDPGEIRNFPHAPSVHHIPELLEVLSRNGKWPIGRIDTSKISCYAECRFLSQLDIQLLQSQQERELITSTLMSIADHDFFDNQVNYRTLRGSAAEECVELPFLDVECAVCFGGGADIGDDLWLVMDYRTSSVDPRVVANEYVHRVSGPTQVYWHEIAPTFSEFCTRMGLRDGTWVSGEPAPISDEILEQLRGRSESQWPTLEAMYEPPGLSVHKIRGIVLISHDNEERHLKPGDDIPSEAVLKIAAGARLSFSRNGTFVSQQSGGDKGKWIEMRPKSFSWSVHFDI